MEALAFIHSAVAYEDPRPEPELRSFAELNLSPHSALMGVAGAAIAVSVLTHTSDAQAALRRGDVCNAVYSLQTALQSNGYSVGGADGAFGNDTEFAVKQFQSKNGLSADGIVGTNTGRTMGLTQTSCGGGGGGGGTPGGSITVVGAPNGLRVRSGASQSSSVIDYVYSGDVLRTTGNATNGFVQLSRGGWISAAYTNLGGGGGGGGGGSAPGAKYVRTNGSPLVVRSGPGTGYGSIGQLNNGARVVLLEQQGNWGNLQGGGWVSMTWVS